MTSLRNHSLSPEEYIKSNSRYNLTQPIKLANYCYAKLNETKSNGIGFLLETFRDNFLLQTWSNKHFLLVAYFTTTELWRYSNLDNKIKNYLAQQNQQNFKSNIPTALQHALKIKLLLSEKNYMDAIALTHQSNLHLNIARENLDNANLPGINFEGVNLRRTNLTRANLNGANLKRAALGGANLNSADLRGADLTDADLNHTNLLGAILDDKSANGIISFVENNPNYFPKELEALRHNIINHEEKQVLSKANDCVALIFIHSYNRRSVAKDWEEKIDTSILSASFQKALILFKKSETEVHIPVKYILRIASPVLHSYARPEDYTIITEVPDEKITLSKIFSSNYYSVIRDLDTFKNAYIVKSRYLVTEFKDNKKIFWDMKEIKEAPFASFFHSEKEKDVLLPAYILRNNTKGFIEDAAYLNSDEIVAIVKNYEPKLTYLLEFYKQDALGYQKAKSESLPAKANKTPCAITRISPNQFAIAYDNNKIAIWSRKNHEKKPFNFTCDTYINISKQSWPFCKTIQKSGAYQVSHPGLRHSCVKIITRYDSSMYLNKNERIEMTVSIYNDNVGLHAVNSEELLFIQGNQNYQLIQKINIKSGKVIQQMERVQWLLPWVTLPKSYYPLADGQTFLVRAYETKDGIKSYQSGPSFIFQPKSMSFYRLNGSEEADDSETIGILKTGERVNIKSDRYLDSRYRDMTVFVYESVPHIKAYHQNVTAYLNKKLRLELQPYLIQDLEPLVINYINEDIQLADVEKTKLAVDPAIFYGAPEATADGLLQRNPDDYVCSIEPWKHEESSGSPDEKDDWGVEEKPMVEVANNVSTFFAKPSTQTAEHAENKSLNKPQAAYCVIL